VNKPSRPVLRYHGGKWKLARWIIEHLPKHRVYVEPFGGAASVLMLKPRSYAEVYNDLDGEIVNLFRVLRDPVSAEELERLLRLTPFARVEFNEAYEPSDSPVEQARRTVVKGYMGFGSAAVTQKSATLPGAGFKATTGFRSNSNRSGTTPAHDWANFPDKLCAFTERLRGVIIENREASILMETHDGPETLFYLDPPYVHSTRGLRQHRIPQSYRFEMSDDDHLDLLKACKQIKGMVVISGYPCDIYCDTLTGWRLVTKDAHADGARDRIECLWINPAAQDRMQRSMFGATP